MLFADFNLFILNNIANFNKYNISYEQVGKNATNAQIIQIWDISLYPQKAIIQTPSKTQQ